MEGRISREGLKEENMSAYGVERERRTEDSKPSARHAYKASKSPARSPYRSYRSSRRRNVKPELIPEGKDLLIVQLLASGVLLLFVLFVSVIDSDGTNAMREKLGDAFSKNTSFTELAEGIVSVKEKIASGAGNVLEIFGSERNETKEENGLLEIADYTPEQPAALEDDVLIDAETLKEINEEASSSKN